MATGGRHLEFHGPHQAGITHAANEQGLLAAFTVTADDRAELRETFEALTAEADRLMSGTPYEPEWAAGGSCHVVRVIRMLVEFWDRTRLSEQEALIGRRKESGAPFNGEVETDLPDFTDDPDGEITPLDAHIRLANPRTPETDRDLIFRSGLSFSRGFDGDGQLDQGLAFVSYQRKLSQFLNTQARLAGEPLEEYVQPEGGGFYFALPGVTDERGFLGEGIFA